MKRLVNSVVLVLMLLALLVSPTWGSNPVLGTFNFSYTGSDGTNGNNPFDPNKDMDVELGLTGGDRNYQYSRLVKMTVKWDDYESSDNSYNSSCQALLTIADIYAVNTYAKFVLQIHTKTKSDSNFWAHPTNNKGAGIGKVPNDLGTTWNASYGYSQTYYDYVYHFVDAAIHATLPPSHANHNAHKVLAVEAEREINSPQNWDYRSNSTTQSMAADDDIIDASVGAYQKLLATMIHAVRTLESDRGLGSGSILVYDGGFQGYAVFWAEVAKLFEIYPEDDMEADNHCDEADLDELDQDDVEAAVAFYNITFPYDDYDLSDPNDTDGFGYGDIDNNDTSEVSRLCFAANAKAAGWPIKWVMRALDLEANYSIWKTPGLNVTGSTYKQASGVNLHNYYNADSMSESIDYLESRLGVSVASTELGYWVPDREIDSRGWPDGNLLGRRAVFMKIAVAKYAMEDIVIWYPFPGNSEYSNPWNGGGVMEYYGYNYADLATHPTNDQGDNDTLKDDAGGIWKRLVDHLAKRGTASGWVSGSPATGLVKYMFYGSAPDYDSDDYVYTFWSDAGSDSSPYTTTFPSCPGGKTRKAYYLYDGLEISNATIDAYGGNFPFYPHKAYLMVCY